MRRLMVLLVVAVALAAGRAAMVTDVQGEVRARSGPVRLLAVLDEGERLELASGARITLSTFSDGHTELASGPCLLEIGARGAIVRRGKPESLKRLPAGQSRSLTPKGENLERLGGSMVAMLEPDRKSPPMMAFRLGVGFSSQSRYLSPPRFALEQFGPARFTLRDSSGKVVWTAESDSLTLQGPPLEPGLYLLEAQDDSATTRLSFEVLSQREADEVAAARREAEELLSQRPDDLSPRLLLIGFYLDRGLLGEASEEALRARAARPGDPQLQALVASLEGALWPDPLRDVVPADEPEPRQP